MKTNEQIQETHKAEYIIRYKENSNIEFYTDVDNDEIRNILKAFLRSYTNLDSIRRSTVKYFIMYFNSSLKYTNININRCFSDESFYNQYKFYDDLDDSLRSSNEFQEVEKLKYRLVAFYRYLSKYEDIKGYKVNCSEIFIDSISSKTFYKDYENGYKFIYYDKFENFPQEDKICILPNKESINNSNSGNIQRRRFDFTKCDERYRNDLKEFVWNNWSGSKSLNHYNALVNFLNFSKQQQYGENLINLEERKKEFSAEFLLMYRKKIKSEHKVNGTIKSIFKIVRKYLQFYSDKYNVENTDLKIIALTKLENNDNGGYIIPKKDIDLIYEKFRENEKLDSRKKLYTIVFEFFLTTKYRFGEILNFRRNCLTKLSDGSYKISYLGKTTNKVFNEEKITMESANLLLKAIKITDDLVSEAGLVKDLIFIERYKSQQINKCKRINFQNEFNKIVKELEKNNQLEKTGYTVNNIRHTFIDNVYKEGRKQDLPLNVLSMIAGNSFKVAKKHYRDANDLLDYVEATNGICISDVDVEGNVLKYESKEIENEVKDGLGKCDENGCNFDIGECLICKNFITFTNREEVFINKIAEIDKKIESNSNYDEIEELNAYKKLLVKYLYKIKELAK